MTEKKKMDWSNAGFAALATSDAILDGLVLRGVISGADRDAILDSAIAKLSSNPTVADAA